MLPHLSPLFPCEHSVVAWFIAGPCSAESKEQLLSTAKALSANGVTYFRAGVWKARTEPGTFEGVGEVALGWLKEVQSSYSMKVGTEVGSAKQAELALSAGLDFLWIGARTTSNPFMVEEIASVLEGSNLPVLVKNPISPSVKLWAGALERFYRKGIKRLAAVHRGFDLGYEAPIRNMPLWHIVYELRTLIPQLPVYFDPSHIAGNTMYIEQLLHSALDRGYSGFMVESHISPSVALSDASQQITPEQLGAYITSIKKREKRSSGTLLANALLHDLRERIDQIDEELLRLLGERNTISKKIGVVKKENNLSLFQPERYTQLLESRKRMASLYGVSPQLANTIFEQIHEASISVQSEVPANDESK